MIRPRTRAQKLEAEQDVEAGAPGGVVVPEVGNAVVARAVEQSHDVTHLPAGVVGGLLPSGNAVVSGYLLARRSAAGGNATADDEIADRIRVRLGRGEPLSTDLRTEAQGSLGSSLGGVRVHRDAESALLADGLGARAFTTGQDVFFGAGQYDPGTSRGYTLLTHELAHTVQPQVGGHQVANGLAVSHPHDHDEVAAAHAAEGATLLRGVVTPSPTGELTVRRAEKNGTGAVDARETYQAWSSQWVARQNSAKARLEEIEAQLRAANPVEYADNKSKFDQGVRDALGRLHQDTADQWELASIQVSEAKDVLRWLEDQEALGRPVTVEEVSRHAIDTMERRDKADFWLALLSVVVAGAVSRTPNAAPATPAPRVAPPGPVAAPTEREGVLPGSAERMPPSGGTRPPAGAPVPPVASWEELIARTDNPTPRRSENGFRSQPVRIGNREVVKVEGRVGPPIPQNQSFAPQGPRRRGEHATHSVGMQLGENLPEGLSSAPGAALNLSQLKRVENTTRKAYDRASELGASVETETFALIEYVQAGNDMVATMVGVIRRAWVRMPGSDETFKFVDFEARVDVTTRAVTIVREEITRVP